MQVKRDYYLQKLIDKRNNGLIKVITGMRRCGKSYLLFELYGNYLISEGVSNEYILRLPLDEITNARYRNPLELDKYVRNFVADKSQEYYIFLDEIQFVHEINNPWVDNEKLGFVDVLLGLMKIPNADIYITGSNSKLLSSDIVTAFRDKGDQIKLYPFCYSEVCRALGYENEKSWKQYYTYGGMPRIFNFKNRQEKIDYLSNLFENTYLKDVLERYRISSNKETLDILIRIIASSIGSLTNPKKISDTFKSEANVSIKSETINKYLDYFVDAFVMNKVYRYDVKGRRYIGSPLKYFFADVGLRNALLEFRQQEENHIMENLLYNELIVRGYSVDVGVVPVRSTNNAGKNFRSQLEVDFIAKNGEDQFYIQSALNVNTSEKRRQETASLSKIGNSFKKVVVVNDPIEPWIDDMGICYVGIREFLSGKYEGMKLI